MKRKHALLPTILALSIGIFPSLVLSQEAGLRANPVGDGAAQNLLSRIDALGDVSVNKVTVEMSFTQPLDHTTRIKDFEEEEKDRILDALQEWLDVEVERDLK